MRRCRAGSTPRVNESRIRLLTRSYSQLGFSPQRAGDRARLSYAAYLGLLLMSREAPDRQLGEHDIARFMAEVNSVLIDRPKPPARSMLCSTATVVPGLAALSYDRDS